jgi:hypothetical protein
MNLILLDTIDIHLKSRYERVSSCLDSDGTVSFLIMPRIAWVKADLETSYYSQNYNISAISACINIDSLPVLKPALLVDKMAIELNEMADIVGRTHDIPTSKKETVSQIFQSLQFVEEPPPRSLYSNFALSQMPSNLSLIMYMDTQRLPPIGVELRRIGNDFGSKGDLLTRNQLNGRQMNIYHTCLRYGIDSSSKPYSFIESYTLKLKGWLSIFHQP